MELSKIKYSDILLNKDPKNIESIVFEQDYPEVDKECDFGVVFGGISMHRRLECGILLYNEDLIDKILVTGGVGYFNKDRETPEALKMYRYLRSKDIPDSDIIMEDKSRNTVENIKNSLNLLKEGNISVDELNYALITSDFHLRRCLGLFAHELGEKENLMGATVENGFTDRELWQKSTKSKLIILKEALRLCMYARNEMIDDIDVDVTLKRTLK